MTDMGHDAEAGNALNRDLLPNRRAAIYAARLAALRHETFIARCQLDNPRNARRLELLAIRLDATDARAADVFARMIDAKAAAA